ncbi:MAG: hypothetical protein [Bacteriophage sp.]|nr:MAG: hypothetical protein [Bacteriophage sp.]
MLQQHIDYSRDALLTQFGKETLKDRYLKTNETSPQQAFMRTATAFASNEAHALRMYGYASKQWIGFASPVLSNAPVRTKFVLEYEKNFSARCFESVLGALPISCFVGFVGDSREEIGFHYYEQLWLASGGGGYKAYWGDLRPINSQTSTGSKTGGLIPFFHVTDGMIVATHQGNNRRGVYGGSIRDNHPEIMEFIDSRKMSGDNNKRSRNIFQTVNVSDAFMYAVIADADWALTDHYGNTVEVIKARSLWEKMLENPFETGCPFIHWIDNSNDMLPSVQKALGLRVNTVNICTEITLATDKDRTAVCCLSSLNHLKRDEWFGNDQFIADCIEFLDNVLEYFIQNAIYACTKDFDWDKLRATVRSDLESIIQDGADLEEAVEKMAHNIVEKNVMGYKKAVYSAKAERAVGLGMMGLDSYFMDKEIAYESQEALAITHTTFEWVRASADKASLALGALRGEAPDMVGTGFRNSHKIAIAPTATNSTIAGGISPALEKRFKNIFPQKTKSGTFEVVEPALLKVLNKYGIDTPEIRKSIKDANGSVQHLEQLTDHERKYLRTAFEVDQMWVVEHAAVAQPYVCQAISVNLFIKPGTPRKYVNALHFKMWQRGLKSRYYIRTEALNNNDAFAEKIKSVETVDYNRTNIFEECLACGG